MSGRPTNAPLVSLEESGRRRRTFATTTRRLRPWSADGSRDLPTHDAGGPPPKNKTTYNSLPDTCQSSVQHAVNSVHPCESDSSR